MLLRLADAWKTPGDLVKTHSNSTDSGIASDSAFYPGEDAGPSTPLSEVGVSSKCQKRES